MADPAIYRPFLAMPALTRPPNLWHYSRRLFYPLLDSCRKIRGPSLTLLQRVHLLRRRKETMRNKYWDIEASRNGQLIPDFQIVFQIPHGRSSCVVSLNGAEEGEKRDGRPEEKCRVLISQDFIHVPWRGSTVENYLRMSSFYRDFYNYREGGVMLVGKGAIYLESDSINFINYDGPSE